VLIGFICGFIGAGGGMMLLLILTSVLGYELKTAVGTSVFIMTFTALTGALSHVAIGGMPDPLALSVCIAATLAGARVAALFANNAQPDYGHRAGGAGCCDDCGESIWLIEELKGLLQNALHFATALF